MYRSIHVGTDNRYQHFSHITWLYPANILDSVLALTSSSLLSLPSLSFVLNTHRCSSFFVLSCTTLTSLLYQAHINVCSCLSVTQRSINCFFVWWIFVCWLVSSFDGGFACSLCVQCFEFTCTRGNTYYYCVYVSDVRACRSCDEWQTFHRETKVRCVQHQDPVRWCVLVIVSSSFFCLALLDFIFWKGLRKCRDWVGM